MQKIKVKVKKTINEPVKSSDIVKPGYGEMGRKLRPNYEKSEIKMASVGKTKKK